MSSTARGKFSLQRGMSVGSTPGSPVLKEQPPPPQQQHMQLPGWLRGGERKKSNEKSITTSKKSTEQNPSSAEEGRASPGLPPRARTAFTHNKLALLTGEDEMPPAPLPPPATAGAAAAAKSRFRNGHASFRLRMLQEQHGSGFEPLSEHSVVRIKSPASCPLKLRKMREKPERRGISAGGIRSSGSFSSPPGAGAGRLPRSVPTSPASINVDASIMPLSAKRRLLTSGKHVVTSPPGTPTKLTSMDAVETLKQRITRTLSVGDRRSCGAGVGDYSLEADAASAAGMAFSGGANIYSGGQPGSPPVCGSPTLLQLRAAARFRGCAEKHESFRLRMFQEQHGFEPVVFVTKKRTRDNKSLLSEFKGGDLNKYTARSYAIQNGNEVFGENRKEFVS